MKQYLISFTVCVFIMAWACADKPSGTSETAETTDSTTPKSIAEGKGIGEVKVVELNDPLNQDMVERGRAIYNMKCAACHRLDDRRVVGPGWEDVTEKRKPEWIMNMITNVDMMLAEDPAAQALLEECLTRMPNQNVSVGEARDVLEFMYNNDSETEPES